MAWKMGIEKRWFAHSAVKAVSQSQPYTEEPVIAIKMPRTNWRAIMAINENKH